LHIEVRVYYIYIYIYILFLCMYVYGVDVDLCIHVPLSHWGIHSGAVLFLFIIFYYIYFF